jgi:hypothetical protein
LLLCVRQQPNTCHAQAPDQLAQSRQVAKNEVVSVSGGPLRRTQSPPSPQPSPRRGEGAGGLLVEERPHLP